MEHPSELPYDDRSPADGELFSIEALYAWMESHQRIEHASSMSDVLIDERQIISDVNLELLRRSVHLDSTHGYRSSDERHEAWRYYEARHMSDEELVAERMRAEDRILRALGAMATGYRHEMTLINKIPTLPPFTAW